MSNYRLKENWMTEDEIRRLSDEAFDFAKQKAADPQHAPLRLIPIVVNLDVCTVQQEGESFDACKDRAIRAQNLVPLYLWPYATMECKRIPWMVVNYLCFDLKMIRVEYIEEGLALMEVCCICSRSTCVGAQSNLPTLHAIYESCITLLEFQASSPDRQPDAVP